MNTTPADEAAHLRRVVPKIRRALTESPGGVARAALRRRLASRDKHLYDAALELLLAVGDVVAVPVEPRGTRYLLTDAARQPEQARTSQLETAS
nr:hypothetical protein [Microbacterium barkeri]